MPETIGIDHIYLAVSNLPRSESFYDRALLEVLEFKKNAFTIGDDPHVQYFNRHFGVVLRPARTAIRHDAYAPGLHHLCFRVRTPSDVADVAQALQGRGISASSARLYPEYAPDYWATFFTDPDGIRLEVTNYREERRARHDSWTATSS